MPTLYMMVGIAGSGKSCLAKEISLLNNAPIISSDNIRLELLEDEGDQSQNKKVFSEVHRRIRTLLSERVSCIYDATNLSRKRRTNFLKTLPTEVKKIAIFVATDFEIIFKQNNYRERRVPDAVLHRMIKTITIPRQTEGWDDIIIYSNLNNTSKLEDYNPSLYKEYDQENFHHTLTLGDHLLAAEKYIEDRKEELDEKVFTLATTAARLHDIGKPLVKSYSTKTEGLAYYYNHEEVGAYMIACCIKENMTMEQKMFLIQTMRIVQHHMSAYSEEEIDLRPYFKQDYAHLGEEANKALQLVHEADLAAH